MKYKILGNAEVCTKKFQYIRIVFCTQISSAMFCAGRQTDRTERDKGLAPIDNLCWWRRRHLEGPIWLM
jgi:hypothetical protein